MRFMNREGWMRDLTGLGLGLRAALTDPPSTGISSLSQKRFRQAYLDLTGLAGFKQITAFCKELAEKISYELRFYVL